MSVNWSGSGTFPVPIGTSRIGWRGAGTIPMWQGNTVTNIGEGIIPVFVGSGSMIPAGMSGHGDIASLTGTAVMLCGGILSGAGFFPKFTGAGQSLGCAGSGSGSFPSWRGAATATAGYIMSGSGSVSSLIGAGELVALVLTGAGSVPVLEGRGYLRGVSVTTLYDTLTLNTSRKAVSQYMNFNFNSLAVLNGKSLGANSTGIFELSGDKDNGIDIYAEIEGAIQDMARKNGWAKPQYGYLTYRSDGSIVLTLWLGEDESWESLPYPVEDKIHEGRAKIARGIKDRFISFGIRNRDGADFEISKLRILGDVIPDKIR